MTRERPAGNANLWSAILLIGPTGSGKTPLGSMIEEKGFEGKRCFHFDFGANLREIVGSAAPPGIFSEDEIKTIRGSLETGALLEDRDFPLAAKILRTFIEVRGVTPADLLVLNGFPRHLGQAEALAGLVDIRRVVLLEASDEVIRERIRRDPGGDRSGREDDALASVRERMRLYEERTVPLVGYYRSRGAPVARIGVSAGMTAEEMSARSRTGD